MASTSGPDKWADWLLSRRSGQSEAQQRAILAQVAPIRERVLTNAGIAPGETVLDVGAGDGLIAFGALPLVGAGGTVILSDISADLLSTARSMAEQLGVDDRCRFVLAPADDLGVLADGSVDVVTVRSVLIYVAARPQALREFYRVLKPGGRLSIFESINRFSVPNGLDEQLFGYDITPIRPIADKLRAVYLQAQPLDSDPMFTFDERDLLGLAEAAGFTEVHLSYEAHLARNPLSLTWEQFVRTAFNPKAPTLQEAMAIALSPAEAEQATTFLQDAFEGGPASTRWALAYVWAKKSP